MSRRGATGGRPRGSVRVVLALGALLAAPAPAALASGLLRAPARVRVGARLTVRASGLVPGRYRLFIGVAASHPRGGRPVECSAPVGPGTRSSGSATFSGPLPARLVCRTGSGPALGSVGLRSGRYSLVVGSPQGPGAFAGQRSFLMRTVQVVR